MKKESYFKPKIDPKIRETSENSIRDYRKDGVLSLLLDSSLISATQEKNFDIKLVECGEYKQVYFFPHKRHVKDKSKEKGKLDIDLLFRCEENRSRVVEKQEPKAIELKNINRSKFQLQRLVKCNEQDFKTFITLTFSDNVTCIDEANKKFHIWRTKIQSIKKDFKYVCVPEFQKRGAVHYHLMTNLEIDKEYEYFRRGKQNKVKLIIPQEGKNTQYDVKYWPYGFTSIFNLKDINVIGYITKYMTKDIDNRLWGKRRYLYSNNLNKPIEHLIDYNNLNEFKYFINNMTNLELVFEQKYIDYFDDEVIFKEYKTVDTKL